MAEQILYRGTVTRVDDEGVYVIVPSLGAGQEQGPLEAPSWQEFANGDLVIVGQVENFLEDLVLVNLMTGDGGGGGVTQEYVDAGDAQSKDRANHTGTQTAATISDFIATVRTQKVTDLAAPTSAFSMSGQKITELGAPTATTDATTKTYVDTQVATRAATSHTHTAANITDFLSTVRSVRLDEFAVPTTNLDLNGFKITGHGSATVATDLTNKSYVDSASTSSRDRANHTGTQTAATISDFDTRVRTNRLDQLAAPTAAVALNAQKITGLANPTAEQDAVTKIYADGGDAVAKVRSNHTGTQTASTISDIDTRVRTSRLDQMAAPTAPLSLNSQRIINLATPTAGADAVTKSYVDAKVVVPHFRAEHSAGMTVGTSSENSVSWGDVQESTTTAGAADFTLANSSRDITILRAGVYQINGTVGYSGNSTGVRYAYVYVNNTLETVANIPSATTNITVRVSVSIAIRLAVGDIVNIRAWQNSGGNLTLLTGPSTSVSLVKIGD